jgi:hypothetical protein
MTKGLGGTAEPPQGTSSPTIKTLASKLGIMVHTCNPSTCGKRQGGFQTSLADIAIPCLKHTNKYILSQESQG